MKSTILSILLSFVCFSAYCQSDGPFKGDIYNKELKVVMRINLYDNDIKIPGQEIFGEIGGASCEPQHAAANAYHRLLSYER